MKKILTMVQVIALSLFALPSPLLAQIDCETTISGSIYYSGVKTGVIYIALVEVADPGPDAIGISIVAEASITTPGPYSLSYIHSPSNPPKNYYIVAQMDVDNSGSISIESFQQSEPSGSYEPACHDEDPITVGCDPLLNIDMYLSEYIQASILQDNFPANFFSGHGQDMAYHNDMLWVCDQTWSSIGTDDIHQINPVTGQLVNSYDLNIDLVTSLEWVGDDLWVSFNDGNTWVLRQYTYNGSNFSQGVTYSLPSSIDWDLVWSLNIAWDGNLMWVQEKGSCRDIYKIDLSDGSIVETIPEDQFRNNKWLGLADISDICFEDGHLWAMNDDAPTFTQIGLGNSLDLHYTFDPKKYFFEEGDRYWGMVKHDEIFYFLQKIEIIDIDGNLISQNYNILTASLDECILHDTNLAAVVADFGRTGCVLTGTCAGDFDTDGDVDGLDLLPLSSCH